MSRTCRARRSRKSSSKLENGSSSNSKSGCGASARAMAVRCCSPPESSCGRASARARKSHKESISSTRVFACRPAREAESDIGGDGQMRKQREFLKHHSHPALFGRDRKTGGGDALAADFNLAVRHRFQTGDAKQRRSFAAARRPQQAADVAGADAERNAVQSRARAVAMRYGFDFQLIHGKRFYRNPSAPFAASPASSALDSG